MPYVRVQCIQLKKHIVNEKKKPDHCTLPEIFSMFFQVFFSFSIAFTHRHVQKSDRINSDRQSGSDQLGSTRIVSDHEKNIKLNEIETFTHLKVKIPVKSGPN